jgi:flavin prenyltransferase
MAAGQVKTRRLVVGISGATGIAYGMRVLELAREAGVETHLVVSPPGQQTRAYETPLSAQDLTAMADVSYRPGDLGAAIASGWFGAGGMIVAPCSARTLAAVAYCNSDNLLTGPRTWRSRNAAAWSCGPGDATVNGAPEGDDGGH